MESVCRWFQCYVMAVSKLNPDLFLDRETHVIVGHGGSVPSMRTLGGQLIGGQDPGPRHGG